MRCFAQDRTKLIDRSETFNPEKKIQILAEGAQLSRSRGGTENRRTKVQRPPKGRLTPSLQRTQRVQRLGHACTIAKSRVPVNQKTVAQEFADGAPVIFDHALAFRQPHADHLGQLLRRHSTAQLDEVLNVEQQKPARHFRHLAHGPLRLRHRIYLLRRPRNLETEDEALLADLNDISVLQRDGMDDTAAVKMGAVAAAKIDERELSAALRMNERVTSRHLRGGEDDIVVSGPAERERLPHQRERVVSDVEPGSIDRIAHSWE